MGSSDLLFLSWLKVFDARGVLPAVLVGMGDLGPDWDRRFSLLLKGVLLGFSCTERWIFSTGDLERL